MFNLCEFIINLKYYLTRPGSILPRSRYNMLVVLDLFMDKMQIALLTLYPVLMYRLQYSNAINNIVWHICWYTPLLIRKLENEKITITNHIHIE